MSEILEPGILISPRSQSFQDLSQSKIPVIPRSQSTQDPSQPKIPVSTGCPHAYLAFGSCLFDIWLMPIWYLAYAIVFGSCEKFTSTKFFKHILHTYLDFSHGYLAKVHFSQSKKMHETRTCYIFIQQFLSISLLFMQQIHISAYE